MNELLTFFTLSEFDTRVWIKDLLFSHPIFLKPAANLTSTIYLAILVFGVAFFTALWLIPQAIRFAYRFALVDHPNNSRKNHKKSTPILGGLSIFISVVFGFALVSLLLNSYPDLDFKIIFGLLSAVSLMVFFGLKDDIFETSPFEKIIFQILTALFVIIFCEVRIQSFDGLFGVYELPTLFSYVFSVFVFVIIVNAFNLIDGIDGLSASIGLISTLCFGVFFFLGDLVIQSLVMFCYSGALLSFLIYNFKKQLFLGDNGSMSLGVVIAFGVFSLITASHEFNINGGEAVYFIKNASIIILALISFPLLDTIRIFFVRLMNGKSPFIPDRNHLHHHLIDLNFSHFKSTLLIVIYTIAVTGIALALSSWNITTHFFGMLLLSSLIYLITWLPKKQLLTKNNFKT